MENQFSEKKVKVLVIGAGVIGLTTALTLAEQGHRVKILSKEFAAYDDKQKLTSQVAAAFWNIRTYPGNEEKHRHWCFHGYERFMKMAETSQQTGVYMTEIVFSYPYMIDSQQNTKATKANFQKYLPAGNHFRHDKNLIKEKGLSNDCGLIDAMSVHLPMIETDMFMAWLTLQCISKGVDFIQGSVNSLLENCDSLRRIHKVDYIVNCTGIAAGRLVQDNSVYPMLGVALTLRNRDKTFYFPASCAIRGKTWCQDGINTGEVIIAPRGNHSIWIGTTTLQSYDKNIGLEHPVVQRMLQECQAFYPPLKNINQDDLHVSVGIRPMRREGPRVERDPRDPFLIHNYGHGSFGVMMSWGCAENVHRIIEQLHPYSRL